MAKHEIQDLPSKTKLDKKSSEQVESLAAELTSGKDAYLAEYKEKQEKLHALLSEKLQSERDERIAKDPEYWNKHQGIGSGPRR